MSKVTGPLVSCTREFRHQNQEREVDDTQENTILVTVNTFNKLMRTSCHVHLLNFRYQAF